MNKFVEFVHCFFYVKGMSRGSFACHLARALGICNTFISKTRIKKTCLQQEKQKSLPELNKVLEEF